MIFRMTVAAGVVAAFLTAMPAGAQDTADVSVAGQVVLRFRAAEGGYTPEQRADIIRTRLIPILSMPNLKADDIRVRSETRGNQATIWVRDEMLVTVGWNLARANQTTPLALAGVWSDRLREALPEASVKSNTR